MHFVFHTFKYSEEKLPLKELLYNGPLFLFYMSTLWNSKLFFFLKPALRTNVLLFKNPKSDDVTNTLLHLNFISALYLFYTLLHFERVTSISGNDCS